MDHTNLHSVNDYLTELLSIISVGTWDWDLRTDKVVYSPAWGEILGYTVDELPQTVSTWERMVFPDDLSGANAEIERHLSGECPTYEAEFRMCCKDGSIIWAQDKGRVAEYDEQGKPLRFMGVLQNVTRLKDAELRLRENQETLDLAVNVAELGTWDWDITGDHIRYNDEYLKMLGYSQSDMDGSIEEWKSTNHPQDLIRSSRMLDDYLAGIAPSYLCEIRMKHRNGSYIWTRDVGKIVARDAAGNPTRLIGGHLNIDSLKRSEAQLQQALTALEHSNFHLESEVQKRTKELLEQDQMLWTVNQISRRLLTFQPEDDFKNLVQGCLRLLGESINRDRVYLWKDQIGSDGLVRCTQIYEWVRGVASIQDDAQFEEILYERLPNFSKAIDADCCLNSRIRDLSEDERSILEPQGIKTILIAPVAINGTRWGFIGVDNCEDENLFNRIEENMLLMSGSMLANTIEKMQTEKALHEMEDYTQIMLDATPLCCNLWTPDFRNMNCNEEAARLFDLSSQQEYLERFHELSPPFQPGGRRSDELAFEYLAIAFKEGYCRFEWLHQKIDGTPIPAEITLVRIKYKDGFITAGYTRDLREFKAMLSALQAKEHDLRTARDEALLSSKAKSNFLANMSHEIRTPMNAISGLSEIILRESEDEKTAEYARGIKSACGNLLNIINDILDISKIESGKLEISTSQYELASLLNDVITISRVRLGSKPLIFVTDIDSHLPAQLVGDEIRMKQILINLLSNAIKFTSEGYISLRVSGTRVGTKATLRFSVKDSGSGIREEDLKRLFAEFERVNTKKNRSIEGTGLGLAISKRLCEMMGGTIEVHSVYGEGSEFVATIPQECPSYERLAQVPESKHILLYEPRELYRRSIIESLESLDCSCVSCLNQSDLYDNITASPYDHILTAALHLHKVMAIVKKHNLTTPVTVFANYNEAVDSSKATTIFFPINCLLLANLLNGHLDDGGFSRRNASNTSFIAPAARVLVVDDNPVNLRVAEGLMAPYQFVIDTAENGLEAIKMVENTQYDLVFMDHMMPEMDGIDATVAIRQMAGTYYKELPIIALTANALVGTREMFIREGMNDFLAKPIEINKLGAILAKWLPQAKVVKHTPKNLTKAVAKKSSLEIAGVNVAQGILLMGGNEENYLQLLSIYYNDGKQKCTSLLQHFTEKNISAFCTEVHALKSASASIGALEVSSTAARLEAAAQSNDIAFIDSNIDAFLTSLGAVLEAIRPVVLAEQAALPQQGGAQKAEGTAEQLRALLDSLSEAVELARIGEIESLLKQLQQHAWSAPISTELRALQEHLAVFDYDGMLACVARIRKA